MKEAFTFAASGDSIIARNIHNCNNAKFEALVQLIRKVDAAFTNVELVTPGSSAPPAAEYGGIHLGMPPYVLDELASTGFNLFNLAHNHALDFGHVGLLDTMEEMFKRKLVYAGTGGNLGEARSPAYLETPAGRVALVAAASTFTAGAQAGAMREDFPGRPGISPLGHYKRYVVTEQQLQQLKIIDEEMGTAEVTRREEAFGLARKQPDEACYSFLDSLFAVGPKPGVHTEANQGDLDAIIRSIAEAKRQADYVIVSLHGHEGPAGQINSDRPADFIIQSARACVAAGADVFVGHGPHMLRGIEIYQGKPIFYSLGNFMFMCEQITRLPSDLYDLYHLPPSATPADLFDFESQNEAGCPKAFHADHRFWETVLPICTFRSGDLTTIQLYPVSLQLEQPRPRRGVPVLAEEGQGSSILHQLSSLSREMGTTIRLRDDAPEGIIGQVEL